MPSIASRPLGYIPALDGVRGIAILLVLLTHARSILVDVPISRYFEFGWMGVDLFFVLSGFLITQILFATRENHDYFPRFYIRRGLRTWPLYYAMVLLMAFGLAVIPRLAFFHVISSSPYYMSAGPQAWKALPFYLFFIQNWFTLPDVAFTNYLFVTWSLCIEEQFYLVWPAVIRFLSVGKVTQLLGGILILSPVVRLILFHLWQARPYDAFVWTVMGFTPLHLDSLSAGCLLAIFWPRIRTTPYARIIFRVLFVAGLLASVACYDHRDDGIAVSVWFVFVALMFVGFVGLALMGQSNGLLSNPLLRHIGRISYGVYLLHRPLFVVFQSHRFYAPFHTSASVVSAQCVAALMATGISLGLAHLSWHYFEEPILKLKSKVAA